MSPAERAGLLRNGVTYEAIQRLEQMDNTDVISVLQAVGRLLECEVAARTTDQSHDWMRGTRCVGQSRTRGTTTTRPAATSPAAAAATGAADPEPSP